MKRIHLLVGVMLALGVVLGLGGSRMLSAQDGLKSGTVLKRTELKGAPGWEAILVQREALRANIDETLTAALITEQGGKEKHRERSQEYCSFPSQFAGSGGGGQAAAAQDERTAYLDSWIVFG